MPPPGPGPRCAHPRRPPSWPCAGTLFSSARAQGRMKGKQGSCCSRGIWLLCGHHVLTPQTSGAQAGSSPDQSSLDLPVGRCIPPGGQPGPNSRQVLPPQRPAWTQQQAGASARPRPMCLCRCFSGGCAPWTVSLLGSARSPQEIQTKGSILVPENQFPHNQDLSQACRAMCSAGWQMPRGLRMCFLQAQVPGRGKEPG